MAAKTTNFTYITSLHVDDCFAYRDFDIPVGLGIDKPFRHLILTGKNGSGKTTILRQIDARVERRIQKNSIFTEKPARVILIKSEYGDFLGNYNSLSGPSLVYKFFKAHRKTELGEFASPISDKEYESLSRKKGDTSLLKQFLVNKKVNQAFAIIDKNGAAVAVQERFFEGLQEVFQDLFKDNGLEILFKPEEYEFYIHLSDGRQITLNQLSDGFSAFVGILLELIVQIDLIQAYKKDYSFDPPGIVLIDEPETHLHLEMQYQVMPMLTKLFPSIQFIVATHSPAVVSSIKDATVFDLTSKKVVSDWVVGSSYSELMQVHFGLDNEFSDIADKVMDKVDEIVIGSRSKEEKMAMLKELLSENERYLSPGFLLAIESQILQIEEP